MRRTTPPTVPPATAPVGNGFDGWVAVAEGDCEAVVDCETVIVAGIKRVALRDGAV